MRITGRIGRAVAIAFVGVAMAACGDEEPVAAEAAIVTGNRAPVIAGTPATTVVENELYDFTPVASDPDGDPIIFGIDGMPGWLEFDNASGRLFGTPGSADMGTHRGIDIWVSDGIDATLLPRLDITVLPASSADNRAPTISGSPATGVTAGTFYDFIPVAADADGDALSFSVQNRPGWASFDSQTGRLSGTPGAGAVGTYGNIVIRVTDGIATASLGAFVIVVNPPPETNTPPTISGLPSPNVNAGSSYAFAPTASDADGDPLSFRVINPPSWAAFNSSNGALSGTPDLGDVGVHAGISIVVSDGIASAALPSFSIEVIDPNSPPTISGTPAASVLVDDPYSFVPMASDPDGDTLSFSITGRPSWASFSAANGSLSGTPGAGDVGSHTNIRIIVTDGSASAVLGPFSIDVEPIGTGTATLSWTPPTENTDGSALTDLAGYVVYWGTAPGNYPNSETLPSPGLTSYVVDNLLSGTTYYFTATAYNSVGVESSFSNEASKAIP